MSSWRATCWWDRSSFASFSPRAIRPGSASRAKSCAPRWRDSGLVDLHAAAGPDAEAPAPGQELEQFAADQLAAPAPQGAHLRLRVAAPRGDHDGREVRARGDQLVGQPGLLRARAHERLGERDGGAVDRLGGRAVDVLERHGRRRPAAPDDLHDLLAAPAHDVGREAADLTQLTAPRGLALGELDDRGVAQDGTDRAVLARRGALAPGGERARHGALARVQPRGPRQPAPDLLGVALVGRLGDRDALLARPLEPAPVAQAALDLVGERQQVLDVAAGVADLLVGQ